MEHRYAAKQHLVYGIEGVQKGDLARGMLEQLFTLDNSRSNRYLLRELVDYVESNFFP
jgi:hypothetical protein